jgi:hypothetical protein
MNAHATSRVLQLMYFKPLIIRARLLVSAGMAVPKLRAFLCRSPCDTRTKSRGGNGDVTPLKRLTFFYSFQKGSQVRLERRQYDSDELAAAVMLTISCSNGSNPSVSAGVGGKE